MKPEFFHFASPAWLWGLCLIPAVFLLYGRERGRPFSTRNAERFADKHLLPHLLRSADRRYEERWRSAFLIWAVAWLCGMLAMAGPQWHYTDIKAFRPSRDVVIVLDLADTMNGTDVKPSRLDRAREKISDFLDRNNGLTIGLVAYAAIPHMVVPLTDDMRTIRNLLPELDTSLVTIEGDRLKPALAMAATMLQADPTGNKSILVIGDGNFVERDDRALVAAAGGAQINTMGIGTLSGSPARNAAGDWVKDQSGHLLTSRLNAAALQALSAASGGIYVQSVYDDSDTEALMNHIAEGAAGFRDGEQTIRAWDEGFYIPALLFALFALPWFRKRTSLLLTMLMGMLAFHASSANAASSTDWFQNGAQRAQTDFAAGRYPAAAEEFTDPYQKGVAAYKSGQFTKAEGFFEQAMGGPKAGTAAEYNIANAQLMLNKAGQAIEHYRSVLAKQPDDDDAKRNLALAEAILRQQAQAQKATQQARPAHGQGAEASQRQTSDSGQSAAAHNASADSSSANADQNRQKPGAQSNPDNPGAGNSQAKQTSSEHTASTTAPSTGAQGGNTTTQDRGEKIEEKSSPASAPQGSISEAARQRAPAEQGEQSPEPERQAHRTDSAPSETAKAAGHEPDQLPGQDLASKSSEDIEDRPQARPVSSPNSIQRDKDADQWLNHIRAEPGSFLRNQFLIEEQVNPKDREEQP